MEEKTIQSYLEKKRVKDIDTGEEYNLTATTGKWGDKNFYKLFMKNFRDTLKGIESQKLQVVLFLMEKMTTRNEVRSTYQEIAAEAKTSYQTVVRTIEILEKDNFLCRTEKGLLINPDVVFWGRYKSRETALDTYKRARKENKVPTTEKAREKLNEELSSVRKQLKEAQADIKKLKQKRDDIEKKLAPPKKPGPKPKAKGEDKDNAGQTSEPKDKGKAARKKTSPKSKAKEEKKDGTGQTSEQET